MKRFLPLKTRADAEKKQKLTTDDTDYGREQEELGLSVPAETNRK